MSHPIIEIKFEFFMDGKLGETPTRYWYRAPRVGDYVRLRAYREKDPDLTGRVERVEWSEEWLTVRVK